MVAVETQTEASLGEKETEKSSEPPRRTLPEEGVITKGPLTIQLYSKSNSPEMRISER